LVSDYQYTVIACQPFPAAETNTAELARRLARYLQWAQHYPGLRFEG
jgi:hypothetical protein